MNCAKCPHSELIEKARACCLACDPDAVSHKGASHVQANDFTLRHAVDGYLRSDDDQDADLRDDWPSYDPREDDRDRGVTNLAPEDEDRLRRAMSSLFGLDALDLLLVQHLFLGGKLSTFFASLARINSRIVAFHGSPRAQAHAAKKRIERSFPEIEPVFRHLVSGGKPSGPERAEEIARNLDVGRVQPDLFEDMQ